MIAPRSADADALATICNVLSPQESLRLVHSIPGAECLIVGNDGRITRSDGWHRFEVMPRPQIALAEQPEAFPRPARPPGPPPWNQDFELVVNFEINLPAG